MLATRSYVGAGLHRYFNFVGFMTSTTLPEDASCLVDMAGVGRYNVLLDAGNDDDTNTFIGNNNSTTKIIVGRYWRSREAMRGSRHVSAETELLKKLYTPELAEQVYQHVKLDHDIFHIAKPTWIAEATGEWVDSVDYQECYTGRGGNKKTA